LIAKLTRRFHLCISWTRPGGETASRHSQIQRVTFPFSLAFLLLIQCPLMKRTSFIGFIPLLWGISSAGLGASLNHSQSLGPGRVTQGLAVRGSFQDLHSYYYTFFTASPQELAELKKIGVKRGTPLSGNGISPDGRYIGRNGLIIDPESGNALTYAYEPLSQSSQFRQELRHHLALVGKRYVEAGTVGKAEVERFLREEEELDPMRTDYIVFTGENRSDTKGIIRIFDGSPSATSHPGSREAQSYKLPLEGEWPNLVLPEREKFGPDAELIELGRLAEDEDVKGMMRVGFHEVAKQLYVRYFKSLPPPTEGKPLAAPLNVKQPIIYIEATESGAAVYREAGFEIFKTPSELGIKPGEAPSTFCE